MELQAFVDKLAERLGPVCNEVLLAKGMTQHVEYHCDNCRHTDGKRCCRHCADEVGHFRKSDPFPVGILGPGAKLFDEQNGFWRPTGCVLPRMFRSTTCLRERCGKVGNASLLEGYGIITEAASTAWLRARPDLDKIISEVGFAKMYRFHNGAFLIAHSLTRMKKENFWALLSSWEGPTREGDPVPLRRLLTFLACRDETRGALLDAWRHGYHNGESMVINDWLGQVEEAVGRENETQRVL